MLSIIITPLCASESNSTVRVKRRGLQRHTKWEIVKIFQTNFISKRALVLWC
uniref:Uncharacterized protein n=1 Tax=Anguilla anguilla TaxID=7936 RepID=A0A0E9RBT8_ANGAN